MDSEVPMFRLKWPNHMPNMLSVFGNLYESQQFTDVTLWLNDGKETVKCHKVILVANSPFFEDILSSLPHKTYPDIVLPQVTVSDMMSILDFIYRGEVNIEQEKLKNVLTLANFLKVKGLVTDGDPEDYERLIDAAISPRPEISTSTPSSAAQNNDHVSVLRSTGGSNEDNVKAEQNLQDQRFSQPIWEYAGHHLDPESVKMQIKEEPTTGESSIIRNMLCQNQSDYSEEPQSREQSYHSRSKESRNGHRRRSTDFLRMDHNPYGVIINQEDESGSRGQSRHGNHGSTIHNPAQKQEWKKYKQYTNEDLQRALQAMESGLSPVAASKEFKVPSRTLYDKAKKLGINMKKIKRNFSSSSSSSSAAFPYGIGGNANGNIYRNLSESEYEEPNGTHSQHSSSSQNYATDQPHENQQMDTSRSSPSPEIRPSTPEEADNENAVQDLSVKSRCDNVGIIVSPLKRKLK